MANPYSDYHLSLALMYGYVPPAMLEAHDDSMEPIRDGQTQSYPSRLIRSGTLVATLLLLGLTSLTLISQRPQWSTTLTQTTQTGMAELGTSFVWK